MNAETPEKTDGLLNAATELLEIPAEEKRGEWRVDAMDIDPEDFRPVHDRLLVRRDKPREMVKTESLELHIIEKNRVPPNSGTVIAVGEGRRTLDRRGIVPMSCEAGDRIVFGKFAGQELPLQDEVLLILRDDEVYGVVERANPQ